MIYGASYISAIGPEYKLLSEFSTHIPVCCAMGELWIFLIFLPNFFYNIYIYIYILVSLILNFCYSKIFNQALWYVTNLKISDKSSETLFLKTLTTTNPCSYHLGWHSSFMFLPFRLTSLNFLCKEFWGAKKIKTF